MPELGTSGSVGTAGEQSPAVTRPIYAQTAHIYLAVKNLFEREFNWRFEMLSMFIEIT